MVRCSHRPTRPFVGVFNFDEGKPDRRYLKWADLGLPGDGPVHVFDFWNREYLGAWEDGMALELSPTSCRVLALVRASDRIELVSTSRHITPGWVDLVRVEPGPGGTSWRGTSRLIANDPYELRFAFPRGRNYVVKTATSRAAGRLLPVHVANHQGWATVRIESGRTTEARWEVTFSPADRYQYPTQGPTGLRADHVGLDGADLRWRAQYYLNAGYQVYLDGVLLGYTGDTSFPLRGLDATRRYTTEVRAVWDDASIGPRHQKAEVAFTLATMLPDDMPLASLEPIPAPDASSRDRGRATRPGTLTVAGKRYESVVPAPADRDAEYDVKGLYTAFAATPAVDDAFDGTLRLAVVGDGRELWSSDPLRKGMPAVPIQVNIAGVKRLVLRSTTVSAAQPAGAAAQGRGRRIAAQAGWIAARLTGLAAPR